MVSIFPTEKLSKELLKTKMSKRQTKVIIEPEIINFCEEQIGS